MLHSKCVSLCMRYGMIAEMCDRISPTSKSQQVLLHRKRGYFKLLSQRPNLWRHIARHMPTVLITAVV